MNYIKQRKTTNELVAARKFWLITLSLIFFSVALLFIVDSPKSINAFKFVTNISVPEVDISSGYYVQAPVISLSCTDKKLSIYYTLDGTAPFSTKAQKYADKPIQLSVGVLKDTFLYNTPSSPRWQPPIGTPFSFPVLRAVCVDEKGNRGPELIESYIIDPTGKHNYTLPVASIVFNPDDIFGYENGIYVMGKKYEDKDNYIKKKIKFDIPWWKYPANYLDKGSSSERAITLTIADLTKKLFLVHSKQKCEFMDLIPAVLLKNHFGFL
jgi:hypothetical protein